MVGITHTWNLVLLGDDVHLPTDEGAAPRELGGATQGSPQTLFHDVFGESAFAALAIGSGYPQTVAQQTGTVWTGSATARLFDGPAYLMPPLETLFDSVMDGFLSLRVQEQDGDRVDQVGAEEEEEEDVEMDVEEGPMVVGAKVDRIVDSQEMGMFIDLFRQHAVKGACLLYKSMCPH
jgi:NET1-associated nuclear protein 1 (U3 small nucleolar RNA-associated protein 17)